MESRIVEAKFDSDFLNSMPEMEEDIMNEFNIYMDGEQYKPVVTEIERRTDDRFKPTLPGNFGKIDTLDVIKNNKVLGKIMNLVICICLSLNPNDGIDPAVYELRIAIISVAVLCGCLRVDKSNNLKLTEKKNAKEYYNEVLKTYKDKDRDLVKRVTEKMNVAFNFIAFSTLNFIRFNHHFPSDKKHIAKKALAGLGDDVVKKLLMESNNEKFYNYLVTAAKIIDDDLFFRTYIKVTPREGDKYVKLENTGFFNLVLSDEIIKIRCNPTPNGFLILDIIYQMLKDMSNKNVLCLLPNFNMYKKLMSIRNTIQINPFIFHPSRYYYNYKNHLKEYEKIREDFLSIMENVCSFVYCYTSNMYDSIASAKCREKYVDKIRKNDEDLVAGILKIYDTRTEITKEVIQEVRNKIEVFDINKVLQDDIKGNNEKLSKELFDQHE